MVSIPAAAGKIHHRQWLGQIRQDQGFQFPQLRVRYILQSPQGLRMLFVSIPAVAGKIHRWALPDDIRLTVSIPAVAGKIHPSTPDICAGRIGFNSRSCG